MLRSLVGSEMCIRDRYQRRVRGSQSFDTMDAINAAWKEDQKVAWAFLLSLGGIFLCCLGVYFTPARIFFYEKFAGTSLPMLSIVTSLVVGYLVTVSSGNRNTFMLKYLGSVPNMLAICLLCFSSYCLNVFLIEHRQDKGVVTGILDDSGTAFQCFTTGAAVCVFSHLVYMIAIPSRVMELKAESAANQGSY
eukprot:TRINITY_DN17477_c0_g1_i1.p1 TRINITY_DN17477_c0_g1~~TRINITY_DN17477_c0_g1_i1.p1  ORF type:complete len:192 (-),score=63.67 TRINITY_DN17477_c0_g1_i1:217-792(-)